MAGIRVDYIINLLADDSQLKKQLKNTSGEISKLTAREKKEIKEVVQARMDGLNAQAKAAKKNPGNSAIVSGLEEELKFMREVFNEMKTLNPAEDWAKSGKVFAQTFSNMNKQLSDLAKIIEPLKGSIAELGASFGDLGFDIAPKIDVSTATKQATKAIDGMGDVIVTRVHNVSAKIQKEYKDTQKFLTLLNKTQNQKYDFKSAVEVSKRLNALNAEYKSGKSELYGATRESAALAAQEILDIMKWVKQAEKDPKSGIALVNTTITEQNLQEFKNFIDAQVDYAKDAKQRYEDEVQKAFELDLADKLTKNLKGLNLSIDLPKQADFVKKINTFVDKINEKKLHTIKVNIDDSFSLNKKKKKKTVDSEQETEDVISQSGLSKFESAIDKMQDRTKEKTKKWREEMLKMLKFKSGDFEFNFGNSLMDSLQQYFYESGHELDIIINEEELKRRIENVVKDSGAVLGSSGGTATFDPKMMASAFYSAIQAALSGKAMPTFDFGDTTTTSEEVSEATDSANESSIKYVKTLDETTIHIDKVVESLKKFAKLSQNSKAGRSVDQWLTDSGIDTSLIRAGAVNDSEIRAMLQDAWMREDDMGHATGSTIVAQIANFFSKYKSLKPDTGAGKALNVLKGDIGELFRMLEIPMETLEEWQQRTGNMQIYESAAKSGRGLALLNKFRPKLKSSAKAMKDGATAEDFGKIKIEDIKKTIDYFAKNGWDTKSLEELRDARKALGDSTNSEEVKAFQDAAIRFYESSKEVFNRLQKQYADFKGDIFIQGRNKPVAINSPKDFLKIPEDAIIVDPRSYQDIGTYNLADERGEHKAEGRTLREQGRQDHQYRKEYEQDILNKEIKVTSFKPLEGDRITPGWSEDTYKREITSLQSEIESIRKRIESERKSVNALLEQKNQLENSISGIAGSTDIQSVKYDEFQRSKNRRNLIDQITRTSRSSLKSGGEFNFSNDGLSQEQSELSYRLQTLLKNIQSDTKVAQELTDNIAAIENAQALNKEELEALRKNAVESGNITEANLYKDVLFNKSDVDKRLSVYKTQKSEVDKRLTENRGYASKLISDLEEQNKVNINKATEEAQQIASQLIEIKNRLYAEAEEYVAILNNSSLSESAKQDTVGKLQNTLSKLKNVTGQFAKLDGYADVAFYDAKQSSNIEKWNKNYTSSEVQRLERQLSDLESQLNKETDSAKKEELKKQITNTKRQLTRRKNTVPANVSGDRRSLLAQVELQLKEQQSALETDQNLLRTFEQELNVFNRGQADASFLEQYSTLFEKERNLLQEINALRQKGADQKDIDAKLSEYEKVQNDIKELYQTNQDLDKKDYALKHAKQYQLQLIEAYEQRRAITDGVADIDKWEQQVNKYGLKAGYGDRAYSQYKLQLVEEFRSKTRAQLKEQLGLNDAQFQVEPTQMSEEVYNLRKQLYETLEAQTKAIVDKFRESLHINDKGMLEGTEFKWDEGSDSAVESTQIIRDVKKHILDELKSRKEILTGEDGVRLKDLETLIQTIKTERDKALSYGGLQYDDIKNDDLIKEQILYQQQIDQLTRQKAEIEADESIDVKEKEKKLALLNQEIQDYQRLILNREKLAELRIKEKEDSKWSAEERQIYYTDKLIKSKESLKKINGEIATLEKAMNEAIAQHGKDSTEAAAAQYAYDKKLEARQRILDTMANANKKLGYATQELESSQATSGNTTKPGGIFGELISAIKEGISGVSVGSIDVDSSDIATETTLRAIFEMLSGGGEASAALDAEKARGREEREARRREEQARVIAEEKQRKAEQEAERSSGGQSKSAKQKDRLNAEGQTQFNAIKNAASDLQKELKDLDKQSVLGKMADQVKKLNGMNKGTVEYLQEQYKLANMVFAYTGKLKDEGVTSDTRKDGTKYLKYNAVLERSEVKKLGDVKSLMVASVKDLADNLIKLGYGAKLGRNQKDVDINQLSNDELIKKFRHLHQALSDEKITSDESVELDKVLKLLTDRGVYKGSKQETVESEQQLENEKKKTTETEKQLKMFSAWAKYKGDDDAKWDMVTGESTSKTAFMKKLRDNGYSVSFAATEEDWDAEAEKHGQKILHQRRAREIGADIREKVRNEAKVEPATASDAVSKEQIAEAYKKATTHINDLLKRIGELELKHDESAQIEKHELEKELSEVKDMKTNLAGMLGIENDGFDEETPEQENRPIVDAINNVGERVVADQTENTTPQIDNNQPTDKSATSQGGIIGIMRTELAQESTLSKVLSALGEIAKKNAMAGAGKANSAQDLLEQFRRMLESDTWEGKERVAYVDLATGTMSNSITGDDKQISAERLNILRSAYKDVMDLNAQVHTHANEDDPYFSKDDLSLFASDFADGITKQILLSKNNMTVLDMDGVQDVNGLLDALAKTEQNFEALSTTADKFGAKYVSRAFNEITPQGLVKMLGIKGIESKYTETETRDSAVQGMLKEDAKVAADMLQESTGRAIKKTVERVGAELMTTTEKTDAKGNKTWSNQISDKYTKAAIATNRAFNNLGLDKEFGIGTDAQLALVDYTNKYAEFLRLTEEFKKNPKQEGLQAQFDKLLPELDAAEEKLNKLIISKDKFLNGKEAIKIFEGADLANAGDSLKSLATARYTKNGLNPGDNIAFNGISETPNGTRLLVDILKNGTIQQYALEVDRATGQVKEFMTAETALANAFQNVNKAMRYNETVMANVAIGDNPAEQAMFMDNARSFGLDAYKEAMANMEKYVADIWNRMANGGASASKEELDYIMALSERVIALGKNVQKTSIDFKNFRAQNPDNVFGFNIGYQRHSREDDVRAAMEGYARSHASANDSEYSFTSFDNDKLQYTLTDAEGKISKVTLEWNELYQQIAMTSNKSTDALDPMVAKIERYDEALQQAVQDGYLMAGDKNFDAFYEAKDGIRFLVDGIKNGHETFDTAKEKLYELRQEALRYGELAKKTINKNKGWMVGTGTKKQVENQYNKIFGTAQAGGLGFDLTATDNPEILTGYIAAYQQLNADYERYVKNNQINNPEIQQQIQQQAAQVQTLGKRFLSSVTQAEKLKDLVEQSGSYKDRKTGEERNLGDTTGVTAQEVGNLQAKMRDFVENTLHQANIEGVKFDAVNQRMTYTFRTSKHAVADMVVQYNDATHALYAYQKQERESLTGLAGFMQSMKAKMKSILQYTTSITSIYRIWGELRRGVQYIREIDSALTELRKVTDETEESYDRFLDTASKTASKVGSTIKEIVSSTADWSRLGYSMEEAHQLAESTSVLLNVSEFQSIEEATSALTSTLQAFGYTASQSMNVVDVLNEVGKLVARR